MTATDDYLARLDDALRLVPHGVASEIRDGIAEELRSLDPDAAAARIAQLGDPAVIAREAMDAGGSAPTPVIVQAVRPASGPVTASRGFAIAAALVLSLGGIPIPFVGWVVGIVLVLMSSIWHAWEKAVAILAPLVIFAMMALIAGISAALAGTTGSSGPVNPLMPNLLAGPHLFVILSILVVIPASGLWLLWRMRGRAAS